jgi:hypothetical protein
MADPIEQDTLNSLGNPGDSAWNGSSPSGIIGILKTLVLGFWQGFFRLFTNVGCDVLWSYQIVSQTTSFASPTFKWGQYKELLLLYLGSSHTGTISVVLYVENLDQFGNWYIVYQSSAITTDAQQAWTIGLGSGVAAQSVSFGDQGRILVGISGTSPVVNAVIELVAK